MRRDEHWPEVCTLMGCTNPKLRGHHHHYVMGHISTQVCRCEQVDVRGTKP